MRTIGRTAIGRPPPRILTPRRRAVESPWYSRPPMTAWTSEEEQRRRRRKRIVRGLLLGRRRDRHCRRSSTPRSPAGPARRADRLGPPPPLRLGARRRRLPAPRRRRADRPAPLVRPWPRLARVARGSRERLAESVPGLRPRPSGLGALRDVRRRRLDGELYIEFLHRLPRRRRAPPRGRRRRRARRRLRRAGRRSTIPSWCAASSWSAAGHRLRERRAGPQGRRHPPAAQAAGLRHLGDEPLHHPHGIAALPGRGGLLRPRAGRPTRWSTTTTAASARAGQPRRPRRLPRRLPQPPRRAGARRASRRPTLARLGARSGRTRRSNPPTSGCDAIPRPSSR